MSLMKEGFSRKGWAHPGVPRSQWLDCSPRAWPESSQADSGCDVGFPINIGCSLRWTGHKQILQKVLWIQLLLSQLLWNEQKTACCILGCFTEIENYLFLFLFWWGKKSKNYFRLFWTCIWILLHIIWWTKRLNQKVTPVVLPWAYNACQHISF